MSKSVSTSATQSRASPNAVWRKPAKTPCAPPVLVEAACPVAELAADAARLLRLHNALSEHNKESDKALLEALEKPDDFIRPDELRAELHERLRAIVRVAEHKRPLSPKQEVVPNWRLYEQDARVFIAAQEALAHGGK